MNERDTMKLLKAARSGDLGCVKSLLAAAGPKPNRKVVDRALCAAVFGRHVDVATYFLSAGANPDQTLSDNTLLMCAAMNGDLPIVKRLIEAGADCHREVKRETALSAALSENQRPVIEYLETMGACSPPSTSLLYASMHGDVERAKRAIADGAGLEKTGGPFRETPLMAAAREGQAATVKLLLKHGANPNARVQARTAIFDAVEYGKNLEVLEALAAAGADLRAKHYDETVLMAAAKGGSLEMVKRLVDLGAAVQARDKNFGLTALDCATQGRHKEVSAYLSGLGAKSDRAGGRALMRGLAREFGGKVVEHSRGFMLNAKLAGNKCQFHAYLQDCSVSVFKLRYASAAFRGMTFPTIMASPVKPEDIDNEFHKAKPATGTLGLGVYSTARAKAHSEQQALASFCTQLKKHLQSLKLAGKECILITHDSIKYSWVGTDVDVVRPKLIALASLIQAVTRGPQVERNLFGREWLLKTGSKVGAKKSSFRHSFGGALDQPVACPQCGNATNRMVQIDLADPALPKTALGRRMLPVFWCLDCLECDAAFFDVSGVVPKAVSADGRTVEVGKISAGEDDLPPRPLTLVPVPERKKAGRKSKLGGAPAWIQMEETPDCPKCEKPMAFVLQLASDSHIGYGDAGVLYAFACPECLLSASLIQSH
jgi:ankyrin repeat protein